MADQRSIERERERESFDEEDDGVELVVVEASSFLQHNFSL